MAKGAATEGTLGALHSQLARVFRLTLVKYERALEALDKDPSDEISNDLIEALVEMQEPNPAMLSAISKFLKDNEIGFDSEELENLNSTQRRLQERRAARQKAGINLSVVPPVEETG